MDMQVIDIVSADTLDAGDTIKITEGFREIVSIEDNTDHIFVITDNGEEISFQPDALVEIYMEE